MIHNVLRYLGGIEQYGMVSLCLFGSLFTGVLLWACLQRKGHLDRMARIPLETDLEDSNNGENTHE